jgi:hypothetical protein
MLRRARATYEYRRSGGNALVAGRVLGHRDGTGALAMRNYVDISQVTERLSLPPPIAEPVEPRLRDTLPSTNAHASRAELSSNGNGHVDPSSIPLN